MPDPEDIEETVLKTTVLPVVAKVVPYLVTALIGALGGGAVHKVEDAGHQAEVEQSRELSLKNAARIDETNGQLVSYVGTVVHNEEQAREQEIRKLERRIDRLVWALRAKGIDVWERRGEEPAAPAPTPQ